MLLHVCHLNYESISIGNGVYMDVRLCVNNNWLLCVENIYVLDNRKRDKSKLENLWQCARTQRSLCETLLSVLHNDIRVGVDFHWSNGLSSSVIRFN